MAKNAKIDGKLNSILGKDSNFTGDFSVKGGLRIDGKLKGNISAENVFLGKDSVIEGNIESKTSVIGGKVTGDIIAEERLELQGNAEIIGDITTKRIMIEEGVIFDGYCDMGQGSKSKSKKKSSSKNDDNDSDKDK
jgi:cytoskeletal protein CcmA (bactofilin family)